MADASSLVTVGTMVPLVMMNERGAARTVGSESLYVAPSAAYDGAIYEGGTLGVEVALPLVAYERYCPEDAECDGEALLALTSLRFDHRLNPYLSVTSDLNVAIYKEIPWPTLDAGLRGYMPTGFGGVVLTQKLGTGLVSVLLPGSVAYDLPVPLSSSTLHFVPELRWDLTFVPAQGGFGSDELHFISGGASVMWEI